MSSPSRAALPLSLFLGAGAVFAAIPVIGYTMAIAAPSGPLLWLKDTVSSEFAGFFWDLFCCLRSNSWLARFLVCACRTLGLPESPGRQRLGVARRRRACCAVSPRSVRLL